MNLTSSDGSRVPSAALMGCGFGSAWGVSHKNKGHACPALSCLSVCSAETRPPSLVWHFYGEFKTRNFLRCLLSCFSVFFFGFLPGDLSGVALISWLYIYFEGFRVFPAGWWWWQNDANKILLCISWSHPAVCVHVIA